MTGSLLSAPCGIRPSINVVINRIPSSHSRNNVASRHHCSTHASTLHLPTQPPTSICILMTRVNPLCVHVNYHSWHVHGLLGSSHGTCYIFVAKPTGSRSSISLLGKAPSYLSSLVTIATPTRSTCSSRYISLVIPKANTSFGCLSFQFSASNDWNELQKSLKLETHISLSNFKHQLSEQLIDHCTCTQPICK